MRINVYSQELTEEVLEVSKVSNTGIEYKAVQFVLHSSPMLHHPPADDDRSAVTFWLPRSIPGLMRTRGMFEEAMNLVAVELNKAVVASYPVAERLYERGFYIPSGLGITHEQQRVVAKAVCEVLG